MAPDMTTSSTEGITTYITHGLTPWVSEQGDLLTTKLRNCSFRPGIGYKDGRRGSRMPVAREQSHGELDFSLNSSDEFISLCRATQKAKDHRRWPVKEGLSLATAVRNRLRPACQNPQRDRDALWSRGTLTTVVNTKQTWKGSLSYRLVRATHQALAVPCVWVLHNTYNKQGRR